jgi:uncharacterized protein involved in cysteine biosynthesis
MANNDMTAPFVLSLIGGIIVLVISLIVGLVMAVFGGAIGSLFGSAGAGAAIGSLMGLWGLIVGVLIIVGSVLMRGAKAKVGAILTLIFGILAFFTPGMGIIVGPILAIVGGALGLSKAK